MGDTFSVCVTVGSFVPVAASVVWSAKFRREHASAVAEYLEYCMDLTRGDKGYLVCQTTLQNSKEQKHDLGDTIVIALVMFSFSCLQGSLDRNGADYQGLGQAPQ